MMKWIFSGLLIAGLACALLTPGVDALSLMTEGAGDAVALTIELCGAYMLWMGLMRIAERAELMTGLSRALKPAVKRLLPGAPDSATAPVALNMAANFFGLGSAATPFGLAAMKELDKAPHKKGAATDAMCMFLAINSAAPELLPASVLALRQARGSADVYCVVLPTFIASMISFAAAILSCMLMQRRGG